MKILTTIAEIRSEIKKQRKNQKTVGFVPTMGYLHEGHLSLMQMAKKQNDIVVASIFVNPTQFGPNEDLEKYPRDLERDSQLAAKAGVDLLFVPSVEEMYPAGYASYVDIEGEITGGLCGKSRPGHFRGVTTVVLKLFNIVMPDSAYFGQKDAQQVAVIQRMVQDMNCDTKVISCPIVREADGLALSSRNVYLNNTERKDALILSKSLFQAENMIKNGAKDADEVRNMIIQNIRTVKSASIDYIEIVNAASLQRVDAIQGNILIAVAVKIGQTRLIDNIIVKEAG